VERRVLSGPVLRPPAALSLVQTGRQRQNADSYYHGATTKQEGLEICGLTSGRRLILWAAYASLGVAGCGRCCGGGKPGAEGTVAQAGHHEDERQGPEDHEGDGPRHSVAERAACRRPLLAALPDQAGQRVTAEFLFPELAQVAFCHALGRAGREEQGSDGQRELGHGLIIAAGQRSGDMRGAEQNLTEGTGRPTVRGWLGQQAGLRRLVLSARLKPAAEVEATWAPYSTFPLKLTDA